VTAYAPDDRAGVLKPLQTLTTLPNDDRGTNATGEIKVHPTGRFAPVANRGHDSIATFILDQDVRLSALGQPTTERTPRSFDIDASGK
jgi:6-phosphogluconolactonase